MTQPGRGVEKDNQSICLRQCTLGPIFLVYSSIRPSPKSCPSAVIVQQSISNNEKKTTLFSLLTMCTIDEGV
jgi:hypothetical protein